VLQANKPETASDASNACLILARAVTNTMAEDLARDTLFNFDIARTVDRIGRKIIRE